MIDDDAPIDDTRTQAIPPPDSVGFVTPKTFIFPSLTLECGRTLRNVEVCYETYGKLSDKRDNAILICHALSGSAHAAGYHAPTDRKPGWWEGMIGPGKAFDTNHYFIVSPNVLGSCYGSTGPTSVNTDTGKPYQGDFPVVTVTDMVNAVVPLMDELGIKRWLSVAGGSMGGMMALQWGIAHPDKVASEIVLASTTASDAQGIALSYIGRQAIMRDPKWNGGFYPPDDPPRAGLSIARMIGHITYVSVPSLDHKFARRLQNADTLSYTLDHNDFQVESYLDYQGEQFVKRFDPNAYLVISRALEYFDLAAKQPLTETLKPCKNPMLVISFSTDWIYPPSESKRIHDAMCDAGNPCEWHNIESPLGHDAFLIETVEQTALISRFLKERRDGFRD